MTFDEYIPKAIATAVFIDRSYPYVSLLVESAELLDVFVKPLLRGDNNGEVDRDKVIKEAGDCYWNLAAICHSAGIIDDLELDSTPLRDADLRRPHESVETCLDIVSYASEITAYANEPGDSALRDCIDYYYWGLFGLLYDNNITESEVLEANLKKLADRAARGVLKGSGGER